MKLETIPLQKGKSSDPNHDFQVPAVNLQGCNPYKQENINFTWGCFMTSLIVWHHLEKSHQKIRVTERVSMWAEPAVARAEACSKGRAPLGVGGLDGWMVVNPWVESQEVQVNQTIPLGIQESNLHGSFKGPLLVQPWTSRINVWCILALKICCAHKYPPWNEQQKHLKMDVVGIWSFPFGVGWPIVRGKLAVSFREGTNLTKYTL